MTRLTVLVFFLMSIFVYANARHIHPYGDSDGKTHAVEQIWKNEVEDAEKSAAIKEEFANMEVPEEVPRNLKPNRFVPPNSDIFFMGYRPCAEEGYKRDYMGICREVWD